jgi:hypothetical protein
MGSRARSSARTGWRTGSVSGKEADDMRGL